MTQVSDFTKQSTPTLTIAEFEQVQSKANINDRSIPDPSCVEHEQGKFLTQIFSKQHYLDVNKSDVLDDGDFVIDIDESRSLYVETPRLTGPDGTCPDAVSDKTLERIEITVRFYGDPSSFYQKLSSVQEHGEDGAPPPGKFELKIADFNNDGLFDYGYRIDDSLHIYLQNEA